jgi:Major Facilitator Superfamily
MGFYYRSSAGCLVVVRRISDPDRPTLLATWLEPDQRQWLEKELNDEQAKAEGQGRRTLGESLRDSRVVALSMIYFMSVTASHGITFFLPQIVKGVGLSNFMSGVASAIPYLVGMIALLIWGWSSDRTGERRWHLIAASVIRNRIRGCRGGRKVLLVARGDVSRSCGNVWCASNVLAASLDVPEWNGCCRRNRTDQFDRKPRRVRWTIHCGLDKGFDKQL